MLELKIHFAKSQEEKKKCESLLNFFKEEKKKNEHTESVSENKPAAWKVEPMLNAIKKNNLNRFCFLTILGGKFLSIDMKYLVNIIENESDQFAQKKYLIKFLSRIRDQYDQTLLHHAADEGKLNCLKILIGCKHNVIDRKTDKEPASCCFAFKNGETKCAKTLFENHVSVNVYDFKRQTPIHFAASRGHQECVELLIRKGADVNAKDENDWTPLHIAAINGTIDCLEVLLANGADVNARNNKQYTPLHIIGYFPGGSKAEKKGCVEMLINAGADIDAKDEDGDTIFYYQFFQDFKVERPDLFKQN
jgi:hypothetical protein